MFECNKSDNFVKDNVQFFRDIVKNVVYEKEIIFLNEFGKEERNKGNKVPGKANNATANIWQICCLLAVSPPGIFFPGMLQKQAMDFACLKMLQSNIFSFIILLNKYSIPL